jgi:hypothetical protein
MSQLGFLVQDHEHLRSLLVRCEPENRSAMYDSLKPYLRFKAKPLDVYIAESADRAARQDLPTIDETGNISPAPAYALPLDATLSPPSSTRGGGTQKPAATVSTSASGSAAQPHHAS